MVFYSGSVPPLHQQSPQQELSPRTRPQPATENQPSLSNQRSAASGSLRHPEQSPRPVSYRPYAVTEGLESTGRYSKPDYPHYHQPSSSPLHPRDDNVSRNPRDSYEHYRNNLSPARNREGSRDRMDWPRDYHH